MGIIAKQTLKGSFLTYVGIGIGFLTAGLLLPWYYSEDQIGVINLLLRYALLFSFFANLGFNGVTFKMFPLFRNKDKHHFGFLSLKTLVNIGGFILFVGVFKVFESSFIERNIEQSPLFVEYINYLIPFVFIFVVYNALDTYNSVLFNTVQGTFLKEFVQRIFILIFIFLFILDILNFDQFILTYAISLVVPIVGILFFLNRRSELAITNPFNTQLNNHKGQIVSVALFSVISGITPILISSLDTIMINDILGTSKTGIYGTMILFSSVIIAPSKALARISTPIIAEAWKNNDIKKIDDINKRSSITQLLFSGLVFIGIWANMDNILEILPGNYTEGKDIVLYLGLGSLINMSLGSNAYIITTSRLYKSQIIFVLIFSLAIVVSNLYFIPIHGMVGAAEASLFALLLNGLLRWIYVWKKLNTQPFTIKTLILCAVISICYVTQLGIPKLTWYIDLPIRSIVITLIFSLLSYKLNLSEDFNRIIGKALNKVGIKTT